MHALVMQGRVQSEDMKELKQIMDPQHCIENLGTKNWRNGGFWIHWFSQKEACTIQNAKKIQMRIILEAPLIQAHERSAMSPHHKTKTK